jgi:hypothetical protein
MRTAIVSGALANKPMNGGNAWSRLSWVLGLRQLGFDVWFIEQIRCDTCTDAAGNVAAFEQSINREYFRTVMSQFGLSHHSALICEDAELIHGPPLRQLAALVRNACLLFNLGGHLTHPELSRCNGPKIYFDDDPGYTQFWHAAGQLGARLLGHDFFFTIGENVGAEDCAIPTGNISWRRTRPPVVLDEWPVCAPPINGQPATRRNSGTGPGLPMTCAAATAHDRPPATIRFTTVASWRGAYGPVQFGGRTYGLKAHEFRKYIALPRCSGRNQFEIALQIHGSDQADLDALVANGWRVADPRCLAASPDAFRRYVQTSAAEFSVAQGIYVDTNSGWFSDRTVRYLASGRPALIQDTGFSRYYPVGDGLLAFRTMDEALDGVVQISTSYAKHCRAARRLAEQYFDAAKVVGSLIEEIGFKSP